MSVTRDQEVTDDEASDVRRVFVVLCLRSSLCRFFLVVTVTTAAAANVVVIVVGNGVVAASQQRAALSTQGKS